MEEKNIKFEEITENDQKFVVEVEDGEVKWVHGTN